MLMLRPLFLAVASIWFTACANAGPTTYPYYKPNRIRVDVGLNITNQSALMYNPSNINVKIGDIVDFFFNPMNHSVTQSNFAHPCVKAVDEFGAPLFDSGFKPTKVKAGKDTPPGAVFVVTDVEPKWFYCRQKGHCGQGMVFSINAKPNGNSFTKFQALAIQQNGTTAPPVTTHAVQVGRNATSAALRYNPQYVYAKVGEQVNFFFNPKNHTVTKDLFATPCEIEIDAQSNLPVFDTGFVSVNSSQITAAATFIVQNEDPQWFHCRQVIPGSSQTHCSSGMVFAINPPPSGPHTFEAFQQLAIDTKGTEQIP